MHYTKRDHAGKRHWKTGCVVRNENRKETYDIDGVQSNWYPKAASAWDLGLLGDRDYQYARARRTSGWKNSRCRRQWERKARRLEKRLRSRRCRV